MKQRIAHLSAIALLLCAGTATAQQRKQKISVLASTTAPLQTDVLPLVHADGSDANKITVGDLFADLGFLDAGNGKKKLQLGGGDDQRFYTYIDPHVVRVRQGTDASPVTTPGPTMKISRREHLTRAQIDLINPGSDAAEMASGLSVMNSGDATTEIQTVGIFVGAKTESTIGTTDACGLYAGARVEGSSAGSAIGGFFIARRMNDTGNANALELAVDNRGTSATPYNATGVNKGMGVFLNAVGSYDSSVGFSISNTQDHQFEVGYAVHGRAQATTTGGVRLSSFRDDGTADRGLDIRGDHIYGVDLAVATYRNGGAPLRLPNNAAIVARLADGSGDKGLIRLTNANAAQVGGTVSTATIVTDNVNRLTADANGITAAGLTIASGSQLKLPKTIAAAGVTTPPTANTMSGTARLAAGESTKVVTNSQVTTATKVIVTPQTKDATATAFYPTATPGSITIAANAAATAETEVYWEVRN